MPGRRRGLGGVKTDETTRIRKDTEREEDR
jgi:hypothetical protein